MIHTVKDIVQRLSNTFYKMKDIGHLVVKVIKAQGLSSADLGGKSDPFAVLEVGSILWIELPWQHSYCSNCSRW